MNKLVANDFDWIDLPAEKAARRLLGCEIVSSVDNKICRVKIVETEAYDQNDEASHTFRGQTNRNSSMFMSAGHLYVYMSYGIHNCMNIVCGKSGFGSGVLIRAVEPLAGIDIIEHRRNNSGLALTNGPGKVAQALGVKFHHNGHDLNQPPIQLIKRNTLPANEITSSKRIGISRAKDEYRRFYIANSEFVSKARKEST